MIDLTKSGGAVTRCTLAGQDAILLRGQTLPLVNLSDALEADLRAVDPSRNAGKAHAVIVRHEGGQAALSVDALHGDQEVVIKPMGSMMGEIPGVAGASILGDGKVALIVDPARTLQGLFSKGQVAA
jgi:two-component system chemotaxis sensor kinase CheA